MMHGLQHAAHKSDLTLYTPSLPGLPLKSPTRLLCTGAL